MKPAIYSPLVLIFFSACSSSAVAGPRIDGVTRCALSDVASYQTAPVVEETPTLSAAAVETDDFACGVDETLLTTGDCAVVAAAAATTTSSAGWAGDLVRRAAVALQAFLRLPGKYGIALFGGEDALPAKPAVKKKPRMLTLF